ncbi:hypothetical protein [Paraburkholderia xenovorans]
MLKQVVINGEISAMMLLEPVEIVFKTFLSNELVIEVKSWTSATDISCFGQ